ncbi:hypothetical protein K1pha_36 [Xanthomonas phage KPhi1]|uniref:Uncharacterized protein n=1 Tax=Xanthomonas phage KPhi1 TaxID=1927017 RepID=A0A3G1GLF6_9CAUD|nr:hypothetical protein KEM13_gp36 [Xanthomonas phage KPhi1]APQ41915.1 hypothetical protein K1pha_36 [Xanthomonas phage KPhi1]
MNTKDKAQPEPVAHRVIYPDGSRPSKWDSGKGYWPQLEGIAGTKFEYAFLPAPACDKPNLLTWQLRNQLQHLVLAGRYLGDRVIETSGAKCMDDFDHELSKAEKLLATHPQPAAAKEQGNA